ncbi:condensin-2 complex subunit H2 [Elysia marginata]|uniref:Condensin-2 complex subunit H2 n=1 Tax=Elysia marginata TaxID=1093978 RepID=A0AAV4FZ37_9GAST|nr:condensin-2 complex subunit H2 [Elysia marginata]
MIPSQSQGSAEERFSHLLQPIRDLAKNWDVNIADFLEEKVKSSETGEEGGEDGENMDNDDDQFLPLDDIQGGNGIYHVEKDASSDKSIRVIQEMPTRLIPLEESEKGDSILYNKKGEMMGNHCDFNMNIGYISTDGSILLELDDLAFLTLSAPLDNNQQLETYSEQDLKDTEDFTPDTGVNMDQADDIAANCDEVDGADFDCDGGDPDGINVEPEVVQNTRRSQRKVTFGKQPSKPKSVEDPWVHLDPHEPSKIKEKPLVKKKPFKIPAELEDKTTKKRKLKTDIKKELPPLHEVVEKVFSHRSKFPKNPLKVPEFPELEEAFWIESKLREDIKKEEIKLLKIEEKEELLKENQWEEEGYDDIETPLEDDDVEDIPRLELDLDLLAQPASMKRSTGNSDTGFQTGFQTEPCEEPSFSYENLVQKYVEKFYASAAEYAHITELSRRVAEWEEKIQPRLEEEESHETFDIHTYGTFVIGQCVRSEPIAFREIVRGKKKYEICRYLLATLQLANVYNVELSLKPDKSGSLMDCLYVTLLSTKRHFEDLEEYRAPSITAS